MNDRNFAVSLAGITIGSWLLFSALRTVSNSIFPRSLSDSNLFMAAISIVITFVIYALKRYFKKNNPELSDLENIVMMAFVLWTLISLIVLGANFASILRLRS